jgi:hypothetical protein
MEVEQTSLYREIEAILNSSSKPVHYLWKAEIHANGETYKPVKLLSIDFVADYEGNFADEIFIELAISGGMYAKRIYPFKDQIDITLFRNPLKEIGDTIDTQSTLQTERYTATLIDTGNPLLEANGMNAPSEDALDLTNIFNVTFQLVNKSLEQLRTISVGGIYHDVSVEDVIKGVLTTESKKVQVEDSRLPKGVDMVSASNKTKRDHIILPQGLHLVHLPEYVHRKCGGVYNSGMGYYLHGDYWYVYPCYDTTRFNSASRTLTVINVPTNKYPSIERTYRQDGSNLVILATGEVRFSDDSEVQQLNLGNGVRFANADSFMEGFTETKGNKTIASRGKNNSEFVSTERKNGNNNVHISDKPIHSNAMVEYSKLARRQGSVLSFVWENSLPSLLFPGMMVKLLYLEDSQIKTLYGVALKAHHYVQSKGQGMTDGRHICRTMLAVFVQRLKE